MVEVDAARCSGRGLCARFCPTGALQFTVAGEDFELTFQAAACIACTICVVACPEHAVNLSDRLALDALQADRVASLAMGELVACANCGIPTARRPADPPPRGHVCRQGAGVVTAQRDEAV